MEAVALREEAAGAVGVAAEAAAEAAAPEEAVESPVAAEAESLRVEAVAALQEAVLPEAAAVA